VHGDDSSLDDPEAMKTDRLRDEVLNDAKICLQKASVRMKSADLSREKQIYKVRDMVLVKLKRYRQGTAAQRKSNKLERRYFEPFTITEKINEVTIRLGFLTKVKIHNVFHSSLFKSSVEGDDEISMELPDDIVESEDVLKAKGTEDDISVLPAKRWRYTQAAHADYVVDYGVDT